MDIRTPIGMMFTTKAAILILYGLFSDKSIYATSLGININLWWGLAMGIFGAVMWAAGTYSPHVAAE